MHNLKQKFGLSTKWALFSNPLPYIFAQVEGSTGEYSIQGWWYWPEQKEGQYRSWELNILQYCFFWPIWFAVVQR